MLARRQISRKDLERYVKTVLEISLTEKPSTKAANILETVYGFVESGRGNGLPAVRGTWWAGYNGLAEYLSYERGRNRENRLNSLWFGDGARLNRRALEVALTMGN
jgi:hypothetical protein